MSMQPIASTAFEPRVSLSMNSERRGDLGKRMLEGRPIILRLLLIDLGVNDLLPQGKFWFDILIWWKSWKQKGERDGSLLEFMILWFCEISGNSTCRDRRKLPRSIYQKNGGGAWIIPLQKNPAFFISCLRLNRLFLINGQPSVKLVHVVLRTICMSVHQEGL